MSDELFSDENSPAQLRSIALTAAREAGAALAAAGIAQSTIRLSVGIEDTNDIIADLELGFNALA